MSAIAKKKMIQRLLGLQHGSGHLVTKSSLRCRVVADEDDPVVVLDPLRYHADFLAHQLPGPFAHILENRMHVVFDSLVHGFDVVADVFLHLILHSLEGAHAWDAVSPNGIIYGSALGEGGHRPVCCAQSLYTAAIISAMHTVNCRFASR